MEVDSFARIALEYIEKPERKARVFLELDDYYYSEQLYNSMEHCLGVMDSIKPYLDQTADHGLLVEYYYKKSSCYFENKRLLQALEYLLKAKQIMNDDFSDTPEIYSSLATIYQQLQAYDNALEMANRGKELAIKNQNRPDRFPQLIFQSTPCRQLGVLFLYLLTLILLNSIS